MFSENQLKAAHQALRKRTARSTDELSLLMKAKGLLTHNEVVDWLKREFELDHGHATTISHLILPDAQPVGATDFYHWLSDTDSDWRPGLEELISKVEHFGTDCMTIIHKQQLHLQRATQDFARLAIVGGQLQIDVVLPGAPLRSGFQSLDDDSEPYTDRFHATVQQQINDEIVNWLRQAYRRAV